MAMSSFVFEQSLPPEGPLSCLCLLGMDGRVLKLLSSGFMSDSKRLSL